MIGPTVYYGAFYTRSSMSILEFVNERARAVSITMVMYGLVFILLIAFLASDEGDQIKELVFDLDASEVVRYILL